MPYDVARALELLRLGTGYPTAAFRDGQEDAIRHIVEGRGRLLVVQRTGWGKSFVYFIATKLLREAGLGPALLISPLLALMRNQIAAATRMGVRAATINSDNAEEWTEVEAAISRYEIDILLISPERLANERFRGQVLARIAERVSLLVIDEAHCISDWGHDFRPKYRLIERIARDLPPNLRLLATTATANARVMDDLAAILGPDLHVARGPLARPSLTLQTIRLPAQEQRLAWLADQLSSLPGTGIIYTLTVRDAERVAAWLRSRGLAVEAYTGQTGDRRGELENMLLRNEVKALVATAALGMGYDKPDLGFVIHYQTPGSVVTYYQQVGRAGRAGPAYGVLLSGREDREIIDYFIESAFPSEDDVRMVIEALEAEPDGLSLHELTARVNVSWTRLVKTLELLSLESPAPIAQEGSRWQLTAATLNDDFWERARRLTRLRREEQRQMQDYVNLEDGHMTYLIRALDGDRETTEDPVLPPLPESPSDATIREAVAFLQGAHPTIDPRPSWPAGGMPKYDVKGRIAPALRAETGMALCLWGDAGWGHLVRQGKYRDGRFSDDLVTACANLVSEWNPAPAPGWVTCIPSLRHPELVPDFARRLADRLGLPFHTALVKLDEHPEQKAMANSVQQARNVDGTLGVADAVIPDRPVLLIDDMVDSRWTFTVAAWLLLSRGCGAVWPLALAQTGGGE